MTVPQIILLNHAASVNSARMRNKMDAASRKAPAQSNDPVVHKGKRLSELNSDEFAEYFQF